jgi:hypothetical protein
MEKQSISVLDGLSVYWEAVDVMVTRHMSTLLTHLTHAKRDGARKW